MKNRFLTAAALAVMLTLGGCRGCTTGGTMAPPPPTDECSTSLPLPSKCLPNCEDSLCYDTLLKRHAVLPADVSKYKPMGAPFVYKDLSFAKLLDTNKDCKANFYFEVFKNQTDGAFYSNVFVNNYTHDSARTFPLPLMKAIQKKYAPKAAAQLNISWLLSSPHCPAGPDVLIKVSWTGGQDYYNMSLPPVAAQKTAPPVTKGPNVVKQS